MQLPDEMTAIVVTAHGGPEVLKPQRRSLPVLKEHEVLIRVSAAGVNRPDVLQRKGGYPPPKDAPPDIPGLEVAGTVVAVADTRGRWRVGDGVCALVPGGGYAGFCAAHGDTVLPIPGGLSDLEAAAIPETFFTVWSNVFGRGGLRRGETLLVHGGSSGIGTTAIMLGKAFGARVFVTAGSDDKCAACVKLGADGAINYRTTDFVGEVKRLTDGQGADVILDMVGGAYIGRNYEAAATDGRIVQIAFLGGGEVKADFRRLMMKRLTHTGSTLRPRPVAEKALIARELEGRVWPLLAAGRCRPVIHVTFPLAEAAAAHALMESSAHVGKIVLETARPFS